MYIKDITVAYPGGKQKSLVKLEHTMFIECKNIRYYGIISCLSKSNVLLSTRVVATSTVSSILHRITIWLGLVRPKLRLSARWCFLALVVIILRYASLVYMYICEKYCINERFLKRDSSCADKIPFLTQNCNRAKSQIISCVSICTLE